MKLGCIFKFLAIVIVILGTSFYLYEKYGKNFVEESTIRAKELAIEKLEKIVDDFTEKEIENPLKEKFAKMFKDVEKKKGEYSDADFNEIISKFNKIVKDNNLDGASLEDLKKIIETKK